MKKRTSRVEFQVPAICWRTASSWARKSKRPWSWMAATSPKRPSRPILLDRDKYIIIYIIKKFGTIIFLLWLLPSPSAIPPLPLRIRLRTKPVSQFRLPLIRLSPAPKSCPCRTLYYTALPSSNSERKDPCKSLGTARWQTYLDSAWLHWGIWAASRKRISSNYWACSRNPRCSGCFCGWSPGCPPFQKRSLEFIFALARPRKTICLSLPRSLSTLSFGCISPTYPPSLLRQFLFRVGLSRLHTERKWS